MSDNVFVCYSRKDEDFVLKLATNLKRRGVPIWLDQWDIPTGANWNRTIERALKECARILIILTPSSIESDEVQSEWLSALDEKKTIVPILYQQCQMPFRLKPIQYIDFTSHSPDDKESLAQILKALGMAEDAPIEPGTEPEQPPDLLLNDTLGPKIQGKDNEVIQANDRAVLDPKNQNKSTQIGLAESHAKVKKSNGEMLKKRVMLAIPLIILISLIAFFTYHPNSDTGQIQANSSVSSERIAFDAFPDGTPITNDIILKGDEFSAKGVLLAGSPESSYCNNANAVAIHGPVSMYNIDFNYLSSSDPQDIDRCTAVPVAITFIEPVRKATLTFAGASVPYTMNAYDSANRLLGTATESATIRGGTSVITTSTANTEIKRVIFGKETAGTMIKEIYYER